MFNWLKRLFKLESRPTPNYQQLVQEGALILDVRTAGEYHLNHFPISKNIPLDKLAANFSQLPNLNQVIITCCVSGQRSAAAQKLLRAAGYTQVYDGGSWTQLSSYL
jgi:phage shock protein E